MTFLEMQTMFGDILASPSAGIFSLTLIKSLINLSARHIYNKIVDTSERHFMTTGTISWVSGTEQYNLPASGAINRLVLIERTDLANKMNLNPIDVVNKNLFQSQPAMLYSPTTVWWYSGSAKIAFSPIPDVSATANITVWYIPLFANMVNDGDTLPADWAADFHEVVVWGAINRAARRLKEPGVLYTDVYEELMTQLISMVQTRQVQESLTIDPPLDAEC